MKKFLLTILSVAFLTIAAHAQLFKASDVAKIADYVVNELQLTGKSAISVKSIYADYGEQMRVVTESKEGIPAKQGKIQALTKEMDVKAKAVIPNSKSDDYDKVTDHYRKKGITTSALNSPQANNNNNNKPQEIQTNLDQAKELSENLKNEFKTQLGVNDNEADQLVKITFEHNLQKRLINQALKADASARAVKMKELNDKTNSKVKNLLNDQQYKKFLMILIKSQ